MKTVNINDLSSRVTKLTLSGNGNSLGTATGFLVKYEGCIFLVTNWHVLSGRSPFDKQPLDKNGAIPDKVALAFLCNNLNNGGVFEVDLIDNEGKNRWIEHPSSSEVDIAAIKLTSSALKEARQLDIETLSQGQMIVEVGALVTIIGYPFGYGAQVNEHYSLPIWKTGHIASVSSSHFFGHPVFFRRSRDEAGSA